MGQFATNLNTMLDEQGADARPTRAAAPPRTTPEARRRCRSPAPRAGRRNGAAAAPRRCARSRARQPSRSSCPALAGGAILKRLLPVARRPGDPRDHRCAACASDGAGHGDRIDDRRARHRTARARAARRVRGRRARRCRRRRSCCATPRCSTTAPRCRRGTGSSVGRPWSPSAGWRRPAASAGPRRRSTRR